MYPTRLAGSQLNLFISGVAAHTWRRRERGVHRVRVLVANHPRLMRELVMATIADQPDIEVVGEVQNESDLADIVEQVEPDVLIIAINKYFYTILGNRSDGRIQVISSDLRLFGNWSDLAALPELPAEGRGLDIPLAV